MASDPNWLSQTLLVLSHNSVVHHDPSPVVLGNTLCPDNILLIPLLSAASWFSVWKLISEATEPVQHREGSHQSKEHAKWQIYFLAHHLLNENICKEFWKLSFSV